MILDCHIHAAMNKASQDTPAIFLEKLQSAGIDGGCVLSEAPAVFRATHPGGQSSNRQRLDDVFSWTEPSEHLFPFFWIDPTECDAIEQVGMAVSAGIVGFKIITSQHAPGDPRAMVTYQAIAAAKKPILFHSGILWDGQPSSINTRPANFEALLDVKGLRFALAHISWPWTDECIAVYGKFRAALRSRKDLSVEMFIDTTPGTPPIYREDALTKLFGVGYQLESNVMFGVDSVTGHYDVDWAKEWIQRDNEILDKLGIDKAVRDKVFAGNLLRFIGAE